jgi:hypothetical protein
VPDITTIVSGLAVAFEMKQQTECFNVDGEERRKTSEVREEFKEI